MKILRLVFETLFALVVFSTANFSVLAQDGNNVDILWSFAAPAVHGTKDIHGIQHHYHHSYAAPSRYSLVTSFDQTNQSGPFAEPSTTTELTTMIKYSDAKLGQFALRLQGEKDVGAAADRTAQASFRVPLTHKFTISGAATISADKISNPAYRANIAPSYVLFFIPEGQKIFGTLSLSAETAHFKTANSFSWSPTLAIGSRANGITVNVGYMFGHLYNADSAATFSSSNQAYTMTGPSISVFWKASPQISLGVYAMPKAQTTMLFTSTNSYIVSGSASYKFQQGPLLGIAVRHMETSTTEGLFLNRSLNVQASLTFGFEPVEDKTGSNLHSRHPSR